MCIEYSKRAALTRSPSSFFTNERFVRLLSALAVEPARVPLEQDTPEYLVYAQYKINDSDPGQWRKVYVTASTC